MWGRKDTASGEGGQVPPGTPQRRRLLGPVAVAAVVLPLTAVALFVASGMSTPPPVNAPLVQYREQPAGAPGAASVTEFQETETCFDGRSVDELEPPVTGDWIIVVRLEGTVRVTLPDGRSFCFTGAIRVPVGSIIDTTDGRVQLITEGSERSAEFFDGIFQVLQGSKAHATTVAKLLGPLVNCDGADPDRPRGRQLWGDGEGEHRTVGNLSAATVRGTKWLVQDRCDGSTLTRVVDGVVSLLDEEKGKTVELKAGDQYIARPGG
jgi:hypothetical protein